MSLNNDVKAPPTQFGAPPVPGQLNKPLAPNAAANMPQQQPLGNFPSQSGQLNKPLAQNAAPNMPQQQPLGNFSPQSGQLNKSLANTAAPPIGHMNPQMNPLINSRPISNQNGALQTMNGPSPPFNGSINQFTTQVKIRFSLGVCKNLKRFDRFIYF